MQLASHGTRQVARGFIHNKQSVVKTNQPRSIHTPAYGRLHSSIPSPGATQRLFTQSRNYLTRFFTHLTAPGLHVPSAPSFTHSLHTTHGSGRSVFQKGLSFPVRVALSQPVKTHFLPRAPTVPRTVAQVGLGTARNFSTGRPIFQHLVENVPVCGRAFYEADWEINMKKNKQAMLKPTKGKSNRRATKEMLKPRTPTIANHESKLSVEGLSELEHYFASPAQPAVATCLLVPLAPTPTTRTPLPPVTSDHPRLLPVGHIASLHASHELHSIRVSTLFARLDAANVWERGVQCSAYSQAGGGDGVCNILKVEFVGWSKAEVRAVIGESGSGWCVLEEIATEPRGVVQEDEDALSETSSILSGLSGEVATTDMEMSFGIRTDIDPAQSFILPTLDFSSPFLTASESASSQHSTMPAKEEFSPSQGEFDPWSDYSRPTSPSPSDNGSWVEMESYAGFGFGSGVSRQDQGLHEPMESLFG